MKDIRLLQNHTGGCAYVHYRKGNPGSPWVLRFNVQRHKDQAFLEAICNDPDCRGRLRIAVRWIEDQLPAFITVDA